MREIFPVPGTEMAVEPTVTAGPAPTAIETLAVLYRNEPCPPAAARPRVRANMIASVDGAASLHGRTGPLSGPADRMVFAVLRSLADVILVGAATARAERYRPVRDTEVWSSLRAGKPPTPPIAVVSASLDLDACERLIADAPAYAPTVVLTTASAAAERRAALADRAVLIVAGEQSVDPARALAALADLGHRNVLLEGGPRLLGHVTEAGLLDELCLTISPVLAGGPPGRILASADPVPGAGPAAGLRLAHVLADDGYLLCRYRHSDPRSLTDSTP